MSPNTNISWWICVTKTILKLNLPRANVTTETMNVVWKVKQMQTCNSLDKVTLCKSIGLGLNPFIYTGRQTRHKHRSQRCSTKCPLKSMYRITFWYLVERIACQCFSFCSFRGTYIAKRNILIGFNVISLLQPKISQTHQSQSHLGSRTTAEPVNALILSFLSAVSPPTHFKTAAATS